MVRYLFSAVLAVLLPLAAAAQNAAPVPNLAGIWRCVSNSQIVSIDLQLEVFPNQQLQGRGTIVYVNTSRIYNVQGAGTWSIAPPDAQVPQWLIRFQLAPQNHAIFSIFARPTGDPHSLYNLFQDPQSGSVVETSCVRIG